MRLAIQIAAGIVMATAVIGTARYLFIQAQLRALTETFQQMEADSRRRNHDVQVRLQAQQRARQRQIAEAKQSEVEARAAEMRMQAAAARSQQDAAARKAAAWAAFHKPKRECDNPPNWDSQVECGNAHMRAKREFEDRWTRGELNGIEGVVEP